MVVNGKNSCNITHTVSWASERIEKSAKVKTKVFDNFADANGFACGMQKRGMHVRITNVELEMKRKLRACANQI